MGAPGTGNSGLAQQQQHMVAMEKLAAAGPSSAANANAGGSAAMTSPSLKKLKREAAQRRKAQARTLKLRAEEQERLQRLEIDVLVEQQRLQRLERQRCEEDARQLKLVGVGTAANDPPSSTHGQPSLGSLRSIHTVPSPLPVTTSATSLSQAYQQQQFSDHASCNSVPRDNSSHTTRLSRGSKIPAVPAPGSEHHHIAVVMAGGRHSDQAAETASTVAPNSKVLSGRGSIKDAGGVAGGWRGNKEAQRAKQAQQQSMRAAVESRRRLARGPRSGAVIDSHPVLPLEDHRVVSTEYQAAGTQALMRVTLLAAGFVIGARGISARLIGQVTGAIVQSWTESCRPDSIPIRLFRIQGKKGVVQAAATLIEQAVSKYKELCDCKRRGEFVQREHMISGVEFYYQPPPRKAFAINPDGCCTLEPPASSTNSTKGGIEASNVDGGSLVEAVAQAAAVAQAQAQLSFNTHHVWLQHLHAQQQHDHLVATQSIPNQGQTTMQSHTQGGSSLYSHDGGQKSGLNRSIAMQPRAEGGSPQLGSFFDWHHQPHPQLVRPQTTQVVPLAPRQQPCHQEPQVGETVRSGVEFELNNQGLQQSMASLEQALQQVRLEQRLLQHNRIVGVLEVEQTKSKQSPRVATINAPSSLASSGLTSQADSLQLGGSLWANVLNRHNSNNSDTRLNDHGIIAAREIGTRARSSGSESATFHLGSSLFSIFGNGAHTIPINVCNKIDCRLEPSSNKEGLLSSSSSNCGVVAPDTYFDFQRSDFLKEDLPAFPFAMTPPSDVGASTNLPEYSLYGHSQVDLEELCVICLDQPGGVRLMACGHTPFCLNCVQGLINCPLCQERIVGLHHCSNMGSSSRGTSAGLISAGNSTSNGGAYRPLIQAKLNGSSYNSWNWVPEASV